MYFRFGIRVGILRHPIKHDGTGTNYLWVQGKGSTTNQLVINAEGRKTPPLYLGTVRIT